MSLSLLLTNDDDEMALKTFELRKQSQENLAEQLQELRQELASLRVQKIAGGSGSKLSKM